MSAASDARGLKRVCVNCGIRFYDFNKRPIECPNCDTEFTGEIKVKGRRGKASIAAELEKESKKSQVIGNDNDNTEEIEQEDGIVSLEDLDEGADEDDLDDDAALSDIESVDDLEDEDLEVEVEKEKE